MKREPRQYFRHTQAPAWGTAVLVQENFDLRTYLFTDGTARTFKSSIVAKFIVPADEPSAEDRVRLERGITSAAAQGPTGVFTNLGTATPKAVNLELEAQIRAARGEVGAFLVYADWLQSKNDPRGELIVAQHQLSLDPDNKKLRAAQAQLLETHDAYFLPPSARSLLAARRKVDAEATSTELTWRYGFIDRVRLARRSIRLPDLEPILVELLAHPSAQFLRSLTLGALGDPNGFSYLKLVGVITKAKPPLLQELFIGDFTHEQMELGFTKLGNVSPLFSSLGELRRLTLRGGSLRFESAIKHKVLEELAITASTLTTENLDRLAVAVLPALRTLELGAAGLVVGSNLFAGTTFPVLERLVLAQTVRTQALLEDLLRSPLIARLQELVLRDGDLADPAVIQLTQHAARWRHLRVLDLAGNRISPAAWAKLEGVGNVIGEQRVERLALTVDMVLARAPDARSAQAAREIARASDWRALGRDGDRLWGQYEGSTANYWVYARLPSLENGCTCPSSKSPCKHALALMLLAAAQHPFAEAVVPAAFRTQSERPRYRSTWE